MTPIDTERSGYLVGAGVLEELSEDDELGFEASLFEVDSFEPESLDEPESFEPESLDEPESFEPESFEPESFEPESLSLEASLMAEPFDRPELRLSFL
jgi:hypothetical protein